MNGQGENYVAGLGGSIGSRVARLVADASVHTRARMGPHQAAVAQKVMQEFTNHVSDEIRSVMAPLWLAVADDPEVPEYLRRLAHNLGTQRGQAWAWIAGTSTAMSMAGGLGLLLQNELQPVIGRLVRTNPHIPFQAADAALMVARGLWNREAAEGDAGQWGMDTSRFARLIEANRTVISPGEAMELFGKGHISRPTTLQLMARSGMDTSHGQLLLPLARTWISIRDGGSMVQRSIITEDELRQIAVRNGYDPGDAVKYSELAGEPLPLQDLMAAQRRGIIDATRARRGWVQGPVRNEWFDVAQKLQYAPMTTVDAADSVNQGHMDRAEGAKIAAWNGLMPEHFQTLIENAGLPPGVELATEAWNRGLLTEAQFTQAFLESRLKNRYVPLYKDLRWRVIPQETVRRLYREGVYTRKQASDRLGWAGFSPEDREALLLAEDGGTSESTKELSKSEVLTLYTDRAIDEAQAREFLLALGYGSGEVEWLITLADIRKARKFADAVIARVRAGYVGHRIGVTEAAGIMDRLHIPSDQREELIDLWDLERLAVTRGLTPAQIKSALRKQLIDRNAAMGKLQEQGYSDEDADLFLRL